ncbi:hypothetical protein [Acetivibrio saccincola]|jgi:hypothetical protein|nr:hypothetical protein [Acetivibrio saccincola]
MIKKARKNLGFFLLFDNRIDNLNRSSALFSGGAIGEIKKCTKEKKATKA